MRTEEILVRCDHTKLSVDATTEDIYRLCDEGMKYHTASVCIPPSYVKSAREYAGETLRICTVIGFPNGYSTTASKCFETSDAINNGADEIDMVINIGWLKDKRYGEILSEIKAVKEACNGHILKVIIETCLFTDEEKIKMCRIVSESGADYIKTSTGFSKHGATAEDIALFSEYVSDGIKIKAAGGISTLADAEKFISLGADRLGTSRVVACVKNNYEKEKQHETCSDTSY